MFEDRFREHAMCKDLLTNSKIWFTFFYIYSNFQV